MTNDRREVRTHDGSDEHLDASHRNRQMSPPLLAKYEELRALVFRANQNDAEARYDTGVIVNDVMSDERKYGAAAVSLLAGALGCKKSSLYNSGAVARAWPRSELTKILARKNARGRPVTWCHLVTLSGLGDERSRRGWLERLFDEALSTRELRRQLEMSPEARATFRPTHSLMAATAKMRQALRDVRSPERPPTDLRQRDAVLDEINRALQAFGRLQRVAGDFEQSLLSLRTELGGRVERAGSRTAGLLLAGYVGEGISQSPRETP